MLVDCPAYLNAHSYQENFQAFAKYGNHTIMTKNIANVLNNIYNETKHYYTIPFSRWSILLCPNIHLTPILIKPGKKDRMIWDGSWLPFWWSVCINITQDQSRSPVIHFGTSFIKNSIRVWNLRIPPPPFLDILLWDDSISGVYMIPKYNPAVAGSLAYAIMNFCFLPIGGNFFSNTIPAEYDPLARARAFLAEHLTRDEPLVMKYAEIINLVKFDVEYDPSKVWYTQATPDTIHKVIYDPANGRDVNTPRNPL